MNASNPRPHRVTATSAAAALALMACAVGTATGQVTDTKIPLNFNSHLMVHAGEQVTVASNANADAILYRSIADRGLYWDATEPHAIGSRPLIGGTGISYGLFNTVGYSNTTAANASTNGLDGIFMSSRVWDRGLQFAAETNDNFGTVPAWAPVYDITALTGDGTTATATTSAPHGLVVGQRVAILGAAPSSFDGEVTVLTVPDNLHFTYASAANTTATGSVFLNSTTNTQALYVVSDGGATMAVRTITKHGLGVGGTNRVTISGSSVAAYNLVGVTTATNAPVSGLTGDGTTVTATTSYAHGFSTGDSVAIAGASGGTGTWNGTFVVTSTGTNSFTYAATGNGTAAGTMTATSPYVFYLANAGAGTGTGTGTRIVAATATFTGPQVTTLASPVTVDALTEIGVLYMISDGATNGVPFECTLTFNNGSTDTNVPVKLAGSDWYGITPAPGTYSPFVSLQRIIPHAATSTSYSSFRGCSDNDGATLQAFQTGGGGPNLQVTEGIISVANMIAGGYSSLAGQQLTKITFQNPATNQLTNLTALNATAGVGTGTVADVNGYVIGQPVEIEGAAQTVALGATGLSGDGFTTTVTAANHGLVNNQTVVISGAAPAGFNTATTGATITVVNANTFTYANATSGTSTAGGTATVVGGAMPLNGKVTIRSVDQPNNRFTFDSAATNSTSVATILVNINNNPTNNIKVTGITASGGVLTVTTLLPHGLASGGGDIVRITGTTNNSVNGQYRTIAAPTANTFTIRNAQTATLATAQRSVERFGRGRGFSVYAASVRKGTPANTTCAAAEFIGAAGPGGISVSGTNSHTNESSGSPTRTCGSGTDTSAVYYRYHSSVASANPITITTCGSFAHNFSVYTGTCGSLTQVSGACVTSSGTLGCGGADSINVSATFTFVATANTDYYIRVAGTAAATGIFTVTVQEYTNTSCSGAAPTVTGDTFGTTFATPGGGTTPCGGGNDVNALWYQYTATGTGAHLVEARTCWDGQNATLSPSPLVSGVTGVRPSSCTSTNLVYPLDTTLAVYSTNQCGLPSPTPIACNDNGCSVSSRLQWMATPGTTYLIRVASKSTGYPTTGSPAAGPTGAFVLHIDDPIHTDLAVPLTFNWNGICHGTKTVFDANFFSEASVTSPTNYENRTALNGFRSIADRGLLFDPNGTTQNAFNYGGTIGYQGLSYQVYQTALQKDLVHLQASGVFRGYAFSPTSQTWANPGVTTPNGGYIPNWLAGNPATGVPSYDHSVANNDVSAMHAVFGPNTKLGLIYHMSNLSTTGGAFNVTLTFQDSFVAVVNCKGIDWYGGLNDTGPCGTSMPAAFPPGVERHRVLGVYNAVQNVDRGDTAASGQLKVMESVISTTSLAAAGLDPTGHGELLSIKFDGMTPLTGGTQLAVFAATLRDPFSYNFTNGPAAIGILNPNMLNAGGTGAMSVTVTLGSAPSNTITSVVVDATALGLGSNYALTVVPGSGTTQWTRSVSFPINSTPQFYSLPFTATDLQGRQATGTIDFTLITPTGAINPNPVAQTATANATFVFGAGSAISSVQIDASPIGLSTFNLNDSGTNGDTTAGDGTWNANFTVPITAPLGTLSLPFTVTDTSNNQYMGTLSITITAPSGACCTNSTGACSVVVFTSCTGTTLTYNGDNTTCQTGTPSPSCTALAICCTNTTGACVVIYGGSCATTATQGSGTSCAAGTPSASCLVAQSCCNSTSGACTLIYGGACPTGTGPSGFTTCGANECPAAGTCCDNATGNCTPTFSISCATTATFSSSVSCTPTPCAVVGVCCGNLTGACTTIYGGSCTGSTTAGVGVVCNGAACVAVGTCCDNVTSACTAIYGGLCPANSSFNGATSCNPAPCSPLAWACCFSDGSCLTKFQNECDAYAGAVWAPGQTCAAYTCPSCTNVLANPGAEAGDLSGWTIDVNAAGWQAGVNAGDMHSGTHYFATSFTLSRRHQLIDLTQFLTTTQLDAAPAISAGEWVHTRGDQGGQYYILIQLLAADQTTVIASFNDGTATALHQLPAGSPYALVSNTFSGYGPGVRYLRFEDGGRDQAGWAGFYGTHFDDAFAGPTQTTAACCATSGCSVISNADCITAGGTPQACGTSCSPSPCPASGVCCRGSTCTTAYTSSGACAAAVDTVAPLTVLSKFVSSSSVCNTPVTVPGTLGNTTSPCCYANYNHNATLEVQDIFDFLNDWFAGKKGALVGGNGTTGTLAVQNIFDFLNSWFAGGCS